MSDPGERSVSERLAALSPAKRALLERRLASAAGVGPPAGGERIGRRLPGVPVPLSFAQQRLWFLDQMGITGHAYHMPVRLRVQGRLDRGALARSLAAILVRHEALRTVFAEADGRPVQVVQPAPSGVLPVVDLRGLDPSRREAEVRRRATREAHRPFDLRRDPSLRATLLWLGDAEHVLLATFHHIASDGWSVGVFVRELSALYEAGGDPRAAGLDELPIQYGDFAAWQRGRPDERLAGDLAYWREQLADLPPLRLPTDRPRPAVESFRGGRQSLEVPADVTARLLALGRRLEATTFMVVLAAFQAVLARYAGQTRFPVGSPIANRTRGETERLIGFFVNSLIFPADLDGDPPFTALVRRVRESALGAYAHQELPFERLVEVLQPDRDLGRNPLFQVVFAFQQADAVQPDFALDGLRVEPLDPGEMAVRFDLELHVWASGDALRGECLYNRDLLDPATASRLMAHLGRLLAEVTARPDEPLSRLSLLTPEETEAVTRTWNATRVPCPTLGVHQLVEDQARRTPDAVALAFEEDSAPGSLSYASLDARASQIARALVQRGVGPETTVAVLVARSPRLVTALLAVLKAGAAFVPLDPTLPAARLELLLRDSGAALVVAGPEAEVPGSFAGPVLRLDVVGGVSPVDGPPARLPAHVHPETLAYVMYTSGSTGEPKGVAVTHRNVVRLLTRPNYLEAAADDTYLLFAPASFDASTLETWMPLAHGARLAVAPAGTPSLAELADFLDRHQVTTAWLTAGLFAQMAEHEPGSLGRLRTLLAGGDVLPPRPVAALLRENPGLILVNGYGPTENTTFTACHVMAGASGPEAGEETVPIGCPITNTQAYVLDATGGLAPPGVLGELHAGGLGVARGYHGRPGATAERFVPDAMSGAAGVRLYRTGDRARWRPDGRLLFGGRLDRQVKVRGFRIEPGEIERHLLAHPAVREAVVESRPGPLGEKRLVAYVVPEAGSEAVEAARERLAGTQVAEWQSVFDEHIYARGEGDEPAAADPLFDTRGWRSSYDDRPLPLAEMRTWAADVVSHVLRRRPRRVLEVGCGTGMLLFQIAPTSERYVGLDVSRVALDHVRAQLARHRPGLPQVHLAQRAAHELTGDRLVEEGEPFDVVILSSVVQYFPDVDYLLAVLESCRRRLRPGGAIVLGDLRHLGLLPAFHASVELHQADPATSRDALRRSVRDRLDGETELALDPALFAAVATRVPGFRRAEVALQRGVHRNELTRFRYHAVLEVGPSGPPGPPVTWIPGAGLRLDDLRARLRAAAGQPVGVTGLPNARVAGELRAESLLSGPDGTATAGALRRQAGLDEPEAERPGLDPEALHRLAGELGRTAVVAWSAGPRLGEMDALFLPGGADRGESRDRPALPVEREVDPARAFRAYANEPLQARVNAHLAADLRRHLEGRLPGYMVPSTFVTLSALPLLATGKADRAGLPDPEPGRGAEGRGQPGGAASPAADAVARTPAEATLTAIWREVLALDAVGLDDNFFKLGGHSLLATQLVARVRRACQVDLPLRSFFEHPTVRSLAALVTSLSGQEAEAPLPVIEPDLEARHQPFPLTEIQQAYWVGRTDTFDLGNVSAHLYLEIDCPGLDLQRFEDAWAGLVARHDMLRAIIQSDGTQVVLPEVPRYRIAVSELQAASPEARDATLAATRQRLSHQVLPADRWPLFEVHGSRLDDRTVRLHFSLDALIGDAQSFALLFIECFQRYDDPGRDWEPLPLTFRDYVLAEARLEGTRRHDKARRYWLDRLATLPPAPQLPLGASPASLRSPRFVSRQARLAPARWQALKARAAREDITPAGLLVTAYAEVLGQWAGEPRFTVNLTLFNRLPLHPRVDELVGDFTSLTLLAVDHAEEEPFLTRARRVQRQLWQDLDHRHFGGVRVIRELARRHGAAGVAMPVVFTSTLGLSAVETEDAGLRKLGRSVHASNQTPQVWLDHGVSEQDGELALIWSVVDQLFPTGLVDDMFRAYVGLVESLADSDEAWSRPVPALLPDRQLAVRARANATEGPLTDDLLHTGFLRQAGRRPDAPAVIASDRRLTYGQLLAEASTLAATLGRLGGGPGALVAVVLPKGWEQVVGTLGVLLAGAAYVPLDPEWPEARIDELLAGTGARLCLMRPDLGASRRRPAGVRVIPVEAPGGPGAPAGAAAGGPGPLAAAGPITPEALAYVIFTSGSTGTPKGVVIDHRGAVNTNLDVNERIGLSPGDRVLALSALTFDLSVWDLFGTLAAGGILVVPDAAGTRDPRHWDALCREHGVTVWNSVPALLQLLVEEAGRRGQGLPPSLRTAMLSGDWIPLELPRRVGELAPGLRLLSLGGATEASIWSIAHPIDRVEPGWTSIPYGRPLRNQTMHVLDEAFRPSPDWVPGDLYIGGTGLARGYWGDRERTAAAFVTHPGPGPLAGARLYRTGDRARRWPDGTIEFLGRRDQQVKVQGFRVELGEIETALARQPGISQAVVTAVGERFEAKRLLAYVVPEDPTLRSPDADARMGAALAEALRGVLPGYMVPQVYVVLDALPVSANGKVDRKALPVPGEVLATRREHVAPRTPVETEVAEVWAAVLGQPRVGVHDNFFEAGGDSLQAIRLVSRLRDRLEVELPLRRLFDAPTVAGLAEVVEHLRWSRAPGDGAGPREEGQI